MACRMSPTARLGLVPIFRLWHEGIRNHLYTNNAQERASAISSGYKNEGILGYLSPKLRPGLVPFHRLFNRGMQNHFYTASEKDKERHIKIGYEDQGILGYVKRAK